MQDEIKRMSDSNTCTKIINERESERDKERDGERKKEESNGLFIFIYSLSSPCKCDIDLCSTSVEP